MKRRGLGNKPGCLNGATQPWNSFTWQQWGDAALETVQMAPMERRSLRNYAYGRNEATQHDHVTRATAWERHSPRIQLLLF